MKTEHIHYTLKFTCTVLYDIHVHAVKLRAKQCTNL